MTYWHHRLLKASTPFFKNISPTFIYHSDRQVKPNKTSYGFWKIFVHCGENRNFRYEWRNSTKLVSICHVCPLEFYLRAKYMWYSESALKTESNNIYLTEKYFLEKFSLGGYPSRNYKKKELKRSTDVFVMKIIFR